MGPGPADVHDPAAAPVAAAGQAAAGQAAAGRSVLEEQRDFFLRSLRDLDAERAAGDIEDLDYQALKDDYTVRAAEVLARLDVLNGAGDSSQAGEERPRAERPRAERPRAERPRAVGGRLLVRRRRPLLIGLAVAVVAALAGWGLVSAAGTRLPGQTVSGAAVGNEAVNQHLLAAQRASGRGDDVGAIKEYEAILRSNPGQVQALTGEGWLLAQARQPDLVAQGLGLLTRAEAAEPGYEPARLYRGIALLSAGQNAAAVPDLQYYLAHGPDPTLVDRVRQALAQAQAGR